MFNNLIKEKKLAPIKYTLLSRDFETMTLPYSRWIWWLVPASLFIHFANLGNLSIYALDEAKNATAAIEMMQTGNWILPTFNHEPRYDKPPLHYYAFVLAYKVFGTNPWAARFFPALLGFGITWIFYGFIKKQRGEIPAFWTAFALTCSPHWIIQFHMAVPDAFLVFFLTCALMGFYLYIKLDFSHKTHLRVAYLTLGLAVLSKGPVALVLAFAIISIYLLLTKGWPPKVYLKLLDPIGILLLIGVILPWYVLVAIQTEGQWITEFIFKHNLSRFSAPMEGHGGGPWKTLAFVLAGMIPFSPLLFTRFRRFRSLLKPKNDLELYAVLAVSVIILFFMVAGTKLPNYTVPAYPFLAFLIGSQIERLLRKSESQPIRIFGWVGFILLMTICLAPYFIFRMDAELRPMLSASTGFLVLGAIGLPVFLYLLWKNESTQLLLWTGACYFGISVTFFYFSMPIIDSFNPVITADLQTLKKVEVYYYKNFNSAFSFYLQKSIPNIEALYDHPQPGYLITREKHLSEFDLMEIPYQVVHRGKDLFERPVTVILKINP